MTKSQREAIRAEQSFNILLNIESGDNWFFNSSDLAPFVNICQFEKYLSVDGRILIKKSEVKKHFSADEFKRLECTIISVGMQPENIFKF